MSGVDRVRRRMVISLRGRERLGLCGAQSGNPDSLDAGVREKIRNRGLGHRTVSAENEDLQRAPRVAGSRGLHLRFSPGAPISVRRVTARIAQPARIKATLAPNAVA